MKLKRISPLEYLEEFWAHKTPATNYYYSTQQPEAGWSSVLQHFVHIDTHVRDRENDLLSFLIGKYTKTRVIGGRRESDCLWVIIMGLQSRRRLSNWTELNWGPFLVVVGRQSHGCPSQKGCQWYEPKSLICSWGQYTQRGSMSWPKTHSY